MYDRVVKEFLKYGLLILLTVQTAQANPPWNIKVGQNKMFMDFAMESVSIDSKEGLRILDSGDLGSAIGVFFTDGNVEHCIGYTTWNGEDSVAVLAYGDSLGVFGLPDFGESIFLKVWLKKEICVLKETKIFFNGGDTNFVFEQGYDASHFGIDSIFTSRTQIQYETKPYCVGLIAISPRQNTSPNPYVFQDSNSSLVIDSLGTIDLLMSEEGIYVVELIEAFCLENSNLRIEIVDCTPQKDPFVLAPDIPGSETFYIESEGSISIYNKRGARVKTLDGPATWDGTNDSGEPQPMGYYFIVVPDEEKIGITIIR